MRNTIKEFIEPTNKEKQDLWEKAVFVFDTNVLLNLYRYSAKTRNSLLSAFESFKDRVWIPYQVAYEYMNKRCEVIYETVQRYEQFKKEIDGFTGRAIETLRLTSNDEEVSELNKYLYKWLDNNKDRNLLVLNADNDEILNKILMIFEDRVGRQIDEGELKIIKEEGKERYEKAIPPGYKDDKKKKNIDDDNNAYGDLIIWKQIIKYAKEHEVGIVYVTHDQKEDWWNIVKGKTIGPRIELRREFSKETGQDFHMYSMNSFISTYNKMNEIPIDKSAVDEVISFEQADKKSWKTKRKNRDISLSEKVARTEETMDKIQNRIMRRKRIVEDIELKYHDMKLPQNIQIQYDNTKNKIQEFEDVYEKKKQELQILQKTINNTKD